MKVPEPKKLKSGLYSVQLRLGGESITVKAESKSNCKKKASLIKSEYLNGLRKREFKTEMTLGEAIDDYISSRENTLSPSTIRGYREIRKNRFPEHMNTPIGKIKDWQKICNKEATRCAPKTLKNAWAMVATAVRYAGVDVPKVSLPCVVVKEHPYLTHEQIPVFVRAVSGKSCEIAALLALHSLRRSEIYALTWDNVDLKKDTILVSGAAVLNSENEIVYKQANKNKSSRRRVPIMIPELKEALNRIKDKEGRIVRYNITTTFSQINEICRETNLPEVGLHGLRHSFASLAYHLGLSERMTMQLGGWSDTKTMQNIYTHLASVDIAKSENIMKDYFTNACNALDATL